MKAPIDIRGRAFLLSTPETDEEFARIVELNTAVHGESVGLFCLALDRGYPGMKREDWYAILDPDTGRALSTLCRIPSTWLYRQSGRGSDALGHSSSGLEVAIQAAELSIVATAEDARGLGLSSYLVARYEADSLALGYTISTIEGIPYYYRRFGYEYAAPLCVQLRLGPGLTPRAGNERDSWRPSARTISEAGLVAMQPGRFVFRDATMADIPLLSRWYDDDNAGLGLCARRDDALWAYLLGPGQGSTETAVRRLVATLNGVPVGCLGLGPDGFGPGYSLFEATMSMDLSAAERRDLAYAFLLKAESERAAKGAAHLAVSLPRSHVASKMAIDLGADDRWEYGWQVKILDPLKFLSLVTPVLEARLQSSVWKGRAYSLAINLYSHAIAMDWDGVRLAICVSAGGGEAANDAGSSASIPPELLAPLALGYRSVAQLREPRHDLSAYGEAERFLDTVFPTLDGFAYQMV